MSRLGKSLKRTSSKAQNQIGVLLSNVEESLGGLKIIKAFTAEKAAKEKFDQQNNRFQTLNLRVTRKKDLASPISEIVGSTVMVGIAYFGGTLVLSSSPILGEASQLNGGEFITYIIIFARLLNPIKAFSKAYANVQKGAASADRIDEIISSEDNIKDPISPKEIIDFKDRIEYKGVTFSYND